MIKFLDRTDFELKCQNEVQRFVALGVLELLQMLLHTTITSDFQYYLLPLK
jgi:hypothetical protein